MDMSPDNVQSSKDTSITAGMLIHRAIGGSIAHCQQKDSSRALNKSKHHIGP